MGKSTQNVQIPGAPAAPAAEGGAPTGEGAGAAADGAAGSDGEGTAQDTAAADRIAALEAENRRLQSALAASQPAAGDSLVFEPDTPHGKVYKAQSKHLHLTSAQLHEKVMAGEVRLADHHVLCKDGWYVNPAAQAQANG